MFLARKRTSTAIDESHLLRTESRRELAALREQLQALRSERDRCSALMAELARTLHRPQLARRHSSSVKMLGRM